MRVLYRPSALADLDAIHDYIATDNPGAAPRVIEHIRQSIDRLTVFPKSGRQGAVSDTNELVIPHSPYIAVFQYMDNSIEIVAVFHGAQQRP